MANPKIIVVGGGLAGLAAVIKIAESGGKKTDQVDARKLAELARADMLPRRVHVAEGKTRTLRELTNARETLLRKRVSLMNSLRGYLRQEGAKLPTAFFKAAG